MFGTSKYSPVGEHEASDEIERVYHEVRQVLRVSGVHPALRTWAGFQRSFPLVWEAVRDNAATYAFEDAADKLRAHAVHCAMQLPAVRATADVPLGPSQLYQIGAALAVYHYVDPKLLLLMTSIRFALDGDGPAGSPTLEAPRLPRGVPPRMYPMEMVDDDVGEPVVRDTFADIRHTLSADSIEGEYRTLALWPGYVAAAWTRLKPIVTSAQYDAYAAALGERAESLVRRLPYRVKLSRLDIASVGEDDDRFIEATRHYERVLPSLMLNVALLTLDGVSADVCMESPFPVLKLDGEAQ